MSAWSGESRAGRSNASAARSQVDAQATAALELGEEQGAVGAEVDEVQQAHVGAQLGGREVEVAADEVDREQPLALAVAVAQQVRGQRGQLGEAVDLDAPVGSSPAPAAAGAGCRGPVAGRVVRGQLRRRCGEQGAEPAELRDEFVAQLRRLEQLAGRSQAEDPGQERARLRVRGLVEQSASVTGRDLPAVGVVRLDPPRHRGGDGHPSRTVSGTELPGRPVTVGAEVEVLRACEVVRRARGVGDTRADAGEAEGTQGVAQVAAPDEVPLVADELEAVRVDGALAELVARDRVVHEAHRLALGDRRLQLGQGGRRLRRLVVGEHGQRRRRGLGEELGPALGEAHECQAQRPRVGEAPLEHGEAGGEREELLPREVDRRQVVGRRRETVQLAAALRVGVAAISMPRAASSLRSS